MSHCKSTAVTVKLSQEEQEWNTLRSSLPQNLSEEVQDIANQYVCKTSYTFHENRHSKINCKVNFNNLVSFIPLDSTNILLKYAT